VPTAQIVRPSNRISSLDGLRGLAALVVVFAHAIFASVPALADGFRTGDPGPASAGLRALLYTPLHIVWAGQEAVMVFFVLSGFVLARAARGWDARRFAAYYPARLLRLYVPIWGAVAVGVIAHALVTRSHVEGATWWLNEHAVKLDSHSVVQAATLLGGWGGFAVDPILWSMRWEIVFSIALPLFALVAAGRTWALGPGLATAVAATILSPNDLVSYMAVFLLGVLLAGGEPWLARFRRHLARRTAGTRTIEAGLTAAVVLGLTAHWWTGAQHGAPALEDRLIACVVALAATAAVVTASSAPTWIRMLTLRPLRWAGSRSYAIYLVHAPVIVAFAFALGGRPEAVSFIIVAFALAAAAGEIFHRGVEGPSHRLSRRLSHRMRRARPENPPAQRFHEVTTPSTSSVT